MEKRIIELEKKMAFQEHALEELNEVIVDQQKKMDVLERALKGFKEQVTSGDLVRAREEEERPPHY